MLQFAGRLAHLGGGADIDSTQLVEAGCSAHAVILAKKFLAEWTTALSVSSNTHRQGLPLDAHTVYSI